MSNAPKNDPRSETPQGPKDDDPPWNHEDGYGHVGEVLVESCTGYRVGEESRHGWAVYRGSEGESPDFVAFFFDEDDARAYANGRTEKLDGDDEEDEQLVFDPCVVPAAVEHGRILAANHYDDEKGRSALRRVIDRAQRRPTATRTTPEDAMPDPGGGGLRGRAGEVTVGDVAQDGTGPWKLFLGEYGAAQWPSESANEEPEKYAREVARVIRDALADNEHGPIVGACRESPTDARVVELEARVRVQKELIDTWAPIVKAAREVVDAEMRYRQETHPGLSGARRQELESVRYRLDLLDRALDALVGDCASQDTKGATDGVDHGRAEEPGRGVAEGDGASAGRSDAGVPVDRVGGDVRPDDDASGTRRGGSSDGRGGHGDDASRAPQAARVSDVAADSSPVLPKKGGSQ